MKNFIFPTILLANISTIPVISTVVMSLEPTEINQRAKQFIVRINGSSSAPKGNGSGSIIEKNGNIYQVLTNWHVVSESENVKDYTIQTSDGKLHKVTKIQELNGADLAIIYFSSNNNYPVATLGDSSGLTEAQTIHYGGYPAQTPRTYQFFKDQSIRGFFSPSEAKNGYEIIFTGEALPGMSGSPLLDENGHIIGIYGSSEGTLAGGVSLYGIKINTAKQLKSAQQIRDTLATPQPSPTFQPSSTSIRASRFSLDSSYGTSSWVDSVAISADGKTLVSGSRDNTIQVWNLPTGRLLRTLKSHSRWVNSVAISADGKILVSGSSDKTIQVSNLATGELLRTLKGHSGEINSVGISADGKTIISGSFDNTIKVWNLATGRLLRTLKGHSRSVYDVAISADGKTVISGSFDNTIKVWNLATGRLLRTLKGHSADVNSVAISADGKTIISGSGDNTIRVWNLATGQLLRTLEGHSEEVNSVAISADGKTIISGSGDTNIKVWRLEQREFDQQDKDPIFPPIATLDKSKILKQP